MNEISVTKHIQLEERKESNMKEANKEATRKEIYDLLDESEEMVQDFINEMHKKRKTKGIENLWLILENLKMISDLVDNNL